jgi:hypothetical protein
VAQDPCAYWRFDTALFDPPIPNPAKVVAAQLVKPDADDNPDECHLNMHNVSDKRLSKAFKNAENVAQRLWLCSNGVSEQFTTERATQLYNLAYPE